MCIKALVKDEVSLYYFLLHYPTRDMQISYTLTFRYPNVFENPKVQRCLDSQGFTVLSLSRVSVS